jgi:hypothetical protein
METALFRDLLVIDRSANGQDPEYERHPEGTKNNNEQDISGQLILKPNGNPIVKKIGLASDWKASAWRLERKFPKQWGLTQKVEHSGSIPVTDENKITVEFVDAEKK